MTAADVEPADDADVERLLEVVFRQYHYDFRRYARAHIRRRLAHARATLGIPSMGELLDRLVRERETFGALLSHLTINVSDLFRDPSYYTSLRRDVVHHLATHPSPRIWVAGCATGEEAYSLAILLHEEDLLDRALIYATDIDELSLRVGQAGAYDLDRVRGFSENYFEAGGRASLSDYYYTAAYSRVVFRPFLRKHILFSDHCLATDTAFAEVQLVSCRNVLIYFTRTLQERAIGLFLDSLCPRGFLGLGAKETVAFTRHAPAFEPFAATDRIYRRK